MHSTTTHSPTTQKAADLMSAAFTINMIFNYYSSPCVGLLYASLSMVPIILSTTSAFVKEPDTFKHVRPMSINGSIARIGLMDVKYAPRPVPLRDTDAAIRSKGHRPQLL